ncbi:ABC transporter permease, partial [Rhodothermus marinus]|uniref:ABC transporter permease n=1 Tax=Rhodothermus marinus TaxID=29549 RepID=UPI000A4750E2
PASTSEPASQVGLLSAPALEQLLTQPLAPPPLVRFEVRGLYQLTSGYDESHVFVALEEAQRLFRMGDRIDGIALRLDDVSRAAALKARLEQQLDTTRYRVQTWYDLQRGLYDVMRLEKWGASLILALIVVVAAFSIVGALTMVVIEKRRDIGVLQAMGLSRKRVRQVFLLAGLLIGVAGAGLGLFLASDWPCCSSTSSWFRCRAPRLF